MSKWIIKQYLKAEMRHECRPPLTFISFEPKGGLGSIWKCDCGKKWEVKQNMIAFYPDKPNKPVLEWGRYGKKDFGLESAINKKEKK